MKRTIENFNLEDKKVLIRVDFNVPMKDGKITDDNRIKESLKTIEYAIEKKAKVILLSHLGRVKEEKDKENNSLKPVAVRLSKLLQKDVVFIPETRGKSLETAIQNMQKGDVLLIENTRFEDIDGKKESGNDSGLGMYWASLGDIFINDAFGTAHRMHASNVGIASHIPSGIGFLVEKELNEFEKALKKPERPLTVILGGSKVSDKIGVIENLVNIADYILVGGAMAYTFLKAGGIEVGASLVEEEKIDFCKTIFEKYKDKIILPIDSVNATEIKEEAKPVHKTIYQMDPTEIGLDIGPYTVDLFAEYLEKSKTIIWNGPVGMFEYPAFTSGTKGLCEVISHTDALRIVGGGDTASAVISLGYKSEMDHISTGGGASLYLLEGKNLPGIDMIEDV